MQDGSPQPTEAEKQQLEEDMMVRFAGLMIQGIEVLKFPDKITAMKKKPALRVLYMDLDQTALYCGKRKYGPDVNEFRFVDCERVKIRDPSNAPENKACLTLVGKDNNLDFRVDTQKSRDLLVSMLGMLIKVRKTGKSSTVVLEDYLVRDRQKLYFVIDGIHLKSYQAVFTNKVKERHHLRHLNSAIIKVGAPTAMLLRFNRPRQDGAPTGPRKDSDQYTVTLKAESEAVAQQWVRKLQEYISEDNLDDDVQMMTPLTMDAADSAFADVHKKTNRSGYLWKRAVNSGRNWKRRFFVLSEDSLAYFVDGSTVGDGSRPKGVVKLTAASTCSAHSGDMDNSIVVITPAKTLFLKAEHDTDAKAWVLCIQCKIDLLKKLDGGERAGSDPTEHAVDGPGSPKKAADFDSRRDLASTHNYKAGYMRKRAVKSGRNWKRRFFVLSEGKLRYYESEFTVGRPKGELTIRATTVVQAGSEMPRLTSKEQAHKGQKMEMCPLMVQCGDLTLHAAAESKADYDSWVAALNSVVEDAKDPEGAAARERRRQADAAAKREADLEERQREATARAERKAADAAAAAAEGGAPSRGRYDVRQQLYGDRSTAAAAHESKENDNSSNSTATQLGMDDGDGDNDSSGGDNDDTVGDVGADAAGTPVKQAVDPQHAGVIRGAGGDYMTDTPIASARAQASSLSKPVLDVKAFTAHHAGLDVELSAADVEARADMDLEALMLLQEQEMQAAFDEATAIATGTPVKKRDNAVPKASFPAAGITSKTATFRSPTTTSTTTIDSSNSNTAVVAEAADCSAAQKTAKREVPISASFGPLADWDEDTVAAWVNALLGVRVVDGQIVDVSALSPVAAEPALKEALEEVAETLGSFDGPMLQEMEPDDLLELGVTDALATVLQEQIGIARSAGEAGNYGDSTEKEGKSEEQAEMSGAGAGVEGAEGVAKSILGAVLSGTTAEAEGAQAAAEGEVSANGAEEEASAGLGAGTMAGADASAAELPVDSPSAESESLRDKVDSLQVKFGSAEGWSEEQVKEWCLCLHSAGLVPAVYDNEMAEVADSLAMFDGAMLLEIGHEDLLELGLSEGLATIIEKEVSLLAC